MSIKVEVTERINKCEVGTLVEGINTRGDYAIIVEDEKDDFYSRYKLVVLPSFRIVSQGCATIENLLKKYGYKYCSSKVCISATKDVNE